MSALWVWATIAVRFALVAVPVAIILKRAGFGGGVIVLAALLLLADKLAMPLMLANIGSHAGGTSLIFWASFIPGALMIAALWLFAVVAWPAERKKSD